MRMNLKPCIPLAIALILCAGCLTNVGCAPKNATFEQRQQHLTDAMSALEKARFKGSFRFNEGGSILGFNASTHWSLGPQQVTLMVEGDVDFTQAPRDPDGVTTTRTTTASPGN